MDSTHNNDQGNLFSTQTFAALELEDSAPVSPEHLPEAQEFSAPVPPMAAPAEPPAFPEFPSPAPERRPTPRPAPAAFAPPSEPATPKKLAGQGWIKAFKILAWILFVVILVGGTGFGFLQSYEYFGDLLAIEGLPYICGYAGGSVLLALLEISGTMVWLNLAQNVAFIRSEIDTQLRG